MVFWHFIIFEGDFTLLLNLQLIYHNYILNLQQCLTAHGQDLKMEELSESDRLLNGTTRLQHISLKSNFILSQFIK